MPADVPDRSSTKNQKSASKKRLLLPQVMTLMTLVVGRMLLLESGPAVPLTRRLQRHRFMGKKLVMTLMIWVVERMLLLGSAPMALHEHKKPCSFCRSVLQSV